MKLAKTFKEFNKIKRKYYKRHMVRRVDHIGDKKFTSYWEKEDWLAYFITSSDHLTEGLIKELHTYDEPEFIDKFLVDLKEYLDKGNYIFYEVGGKVYDFKGIVLTNRDYYLLLSLNDEQFRVNVPVNYKDCIIEKENE